MKQIRLNTGKRLAITKCDEDCPIYNNEYLGCNLNYSLFPEKGMNIPIACRLEDFMRWMKMNDILRDK